MMRVLIALLVITAFGGCAGPPRLESSEAHDCTARVGQALRDRESELAAVRAEVAASKIAAAKQAAELHELRNVVPQLRQDNAASHQALAAMRQELSARQAEAERARAAREEAEQTKHTQQLTDLHGTVAALTQELDRLKQDIQQNIRQSAGASAEAGPSLSATNGGRTPPAVPMIPEAAFTPPEANSLLLPVRLDSSGVGQGDESLMHVTVKSGDTLWGLAQWYRVTVEDLRRVNRLRSDRLSIGQVLRLPSHSSRSWPSR